MEELYNIRQIRVGSFIIFDGRKFEVVTNYKHYNLCTSDDGVSTIFNDWTLFEKVSENTYRKIENVENVETA